MLALLQTVGRPVFTSGTAAVSAGFTSGAAAASAAPDCRTLAVPIDVV